MNIDNLNLNHHHHHPLHPYQPSDRTEDQLTTPSTIPPPTSKTTTKTNQSNKLRLQTIPLPSYSAPPSASSSTSAPSSPARSVSSYASSTNHLTLIHPQNSLASLSLSSPNTNIHQQQQLPNSINPVLNTNSNPLQQQQQQQQSDPSSAITINPSHLHNRSIPPPLTLLSNLPKSQDPSSTNTSDDLMTARCSQFPLDSLEPRHPTIGSCRFQPYLPPLPTDPSAWSNEPKPQPNNPPRTIFNPSQLSPSHFTSALDDSSLSSNELHSSCSSLASSTKSSQSSTYFPSSNPNNLAFQDSSSTPAVRDVLYPPLASSGFSQTAVYPSYSGPPSRTSIGLAYPTAAFTPSGGSPPIASASSAYFHHFDSAGAGRRHTVSAYASPMPIELGQVSNQDFDETMIKEEKRRRNKESSQRFRDRTRERQREKQERLEYLERRTKELENQLRLRPRGDEMQDDVKTPEQPSASTADREMNEKLWAENERLKSMLKKASDEIHRLQQLAGIQSPHSPLGTGQLYATLAQLSPAASTDLTPGSQSSSPAGDQSYFSAIHRGTSPGSDTASSAQRLTQAPVGQPNPGSFSPADHRAPLDQPLSFHHPHQPMATTPNEFWDPAGEASNIVTGWQAIDHQ